MTRSVAALLVVVVVVGLGVVSGIAYATGMQGGGLSGSANFSSSCASMASSGGKVDVSVPAGDIIDLAGGSCGGSGSADTLKDVSGTATFSAGIVASATGCAMNTSITGCANITASNSVTGSTNVVAGAGNASIIDATGYSTNATAPGQFRCTGSAVCSLGSVGQLYERQPARRGILQTVASGDTALTVIGLPTPVNTCTGACTPANDVTDTNYVSMVLYPTANVSGNSCGDCAGPFTMTRATALPIAMFVVRTDPSAVTTVSYYVGLASASLDQVTTLAGANAIRGCYFRFDTGLADTTWQAESSDGTTASVSDTTISVAAATTYILTIDNSVSGECDYYVNGVRKVAKTTNINAASTLYDVHYSVTTRAAAVRNLSIAEVQLQQR